MLIQLTVHRRGSGPGIILYPSAYEARPNRGACRCQLYYYYSKSRTCGNPLKLHTKDLKQTSAKEQTNPVG
jgi:hypothetical protein